MRIKQMDKMTVLSPSRPTTIRIVKRDLLTDIPCFFLLVFAYLPVSAVLLGRWGNYIKYAFVLAFLIGVLKRDVKLFLRMGLILAIGFLFSVYYYSQLWRLHNTFPNFMAKSMLCWVYPCFALYYAKYGDPARKGSMRKIWMLILVVTSITTFVSVSMHPDASRSLANSRLNDDQAMELYLRNTATWGMMYGMVFTLPMWIVEQKKTRNFQYLLVIIAVTVCAVRAQITFALIFALFFLLFSFIHKLNRRKLRIIIILLLLIIPLRGVVASLLYYIYDHIEGSSLTVLKSRIYQVYMMLGENHIMGDADARLTLYANSFMTFLRHPLLGYRVSTVGYDKIGLHSQVFDVMGATGIIGTIAYFGIFVYITEKTLINIKDAQVKAYSLTALMGLVMFMLVNPTWYAPESYMSVFFLPFLVDVEEPRAVSD